LPLPSQLTYGNKQTSANYSSQASDLIALESNTSTTTTADDDMGNSLRCCLTCMIPCGSFDVVRVVHLSGRVDEFSCPITSGAVLAAHPNHTLATAWSSAGVGCPTKKLVIVSPDTELKCGRIYFLIPSATVPAADRRKSRPSSKKSKRPSSQGKSGGASTAEQDNYLTDLLSEKAASGAHRRRRSSCRVAVWRPELECIVEETSD
jgi:hypothetical protein